VTSTRDASPSEACWSCAAASSAIRLSASVASQAISGAKCWDHQILGGPLGNPAREFGGVVPINVEKALAG